MPVIGNSFGLLETWYPISTQSLIIVVVNGKQKMDSILDLHFAVPWIFFWSYCDNNNNKSSKRREVTKKINCRIGKCIADFSVIPLDVTALTRSK